MDVSFGMAIRLLLLGTLWLGAFGQPVTLTDVARQRDAASRTKGLTDEERTEVLALYEQAAHSLQQEIRWKAQQIGHSRTKSVIEGELAAAHGAASTPLPGPPPAPQSETAQQVDDELARVRSNRASLLKRRDELSRLTATLTDRAEAIATRRAEIREQIQSIGDEMSVLALASASPQWEQASRTALQARRQAVQEELLAIGMERDAVELRRQLIPLQREAYLLKLEADERYLADLAVRKANARTQDTKRSLDATVAEARSLSKGIPKLAALSAEVEALASGLWGEQGIEVKVDRTAAHAERMRVALGRFTEITTNTRRRYENSGLFSSADQWWPPRVKEYGKPAEVGALAISFATAGIIARREMFQLEEDRNTSPAFETELQQVLQAAGNPPADVTPTDLQSRARALLQLKRKLTTELLTSVRAYANQLDEAHRLAEDLLRSMRELQSFVLQRALWSRSVTGPLLPSPSGVGDAIVWFVSPGSWSRIARDFLAAGWRILGWVAGLLLIGALLALQGRWSQWLSTSRAQGPRRSRMNFLLGNIVRGVLLALPVPLAIFYTGWVIGQASPEVDLAGALASGAAQSAWFLFLCILVRQTLTPDGAAARLLGWPEEVRESLDTAVRRIALVFTPLCFVATALAEEGIYPHGDTQLQSHHNSLGRLCFLLGVLALLVFSRRVLRRGGPVANALGPGFDSRGFVRARLFRALTYLVFASAFLMALAGFYITAYLLVENTLKTATFTFALILVFAFLHQWRLDQGERMSASGEPDNRQTALEADVQVRRLSRFGLTLVWIVGVLVIWSAALPSLSMLNRVQILPEFRITKESTQTPDSQPAPVAPAKPQPKEAQPPQAAVLPVPAPPKEPQPQAQAEPRSPLYLSGLMVAIFIAILTSMLVSNIPGLLQFTIFRRLSLDTGGQYAVNTIARYLVIILGLIVVSSILGLSWSKIQWLAAALTFGIGFGLQEIFANFAAGLILLLDRSIRVGDAVSVGELSGIVSRIQMRATTVTLWDHSDMIVPNKEFITTKLVNWTLSNPDTRVDLKVGVGYGSDVEQVREVLLQIAAAHPAVLKTPPPQVLLTEFSASSINFELRVFGLYAYGRPVLLDELHRAVVREFRERQIEIAFPQLDVHLRPNQPEASCSGASEAG